MMNFFNFNHFGDYVRGKFKSYKKGECCPVCKKHSSKCRKSDANPRFRYCGNVDIPYGQYVGEWQCVDKNRRGHGLAFAQRDKNRFGWDREKETRRLQDEQLLAKLAAKKKEEKSKQFVAQAPQCLSAEERHKYNTEILNELTLDSESLENLKRRGFTEEQIKECGFKSIKRNQGLSKKYPKALPGISWSGKSLFIGGAGTIIPIRNTEGLIVALQLRFHKVLDDGGRYRWISTPSTAVLQTKEFEELPLAIYIPSKLKTFKIVFPEGTGHKPYLAAERMGAIAIGAAGGLHASSPDTLLDALAKIESALKEVVINFSATTKEAEVQGEGRKGEATTINSQVQNHPSPCPPLPAPLHSSGSWLKTQLHKSLELGLAEERDCKNDTEKIKDTKLKDIVSPELLARQGSVRENSYLPTNFHDLDNKLTTEEVESGGLKYGTLTVLASRTPSTSKAFLKQICSNSKHVLFEKSTLQEICISVLAGNYDVIKIADLNSLTDNNFKTSDVLRILNELAVQCNVAIVCLAQVEEIAPRTNNRFQVEEILDYKAVKKYSDLILGLHQEEFFDPETKDRGLVEIKLLNSATKEIAALDVVHLLFDEKNQENPFKNLAGGNSLLLHKLWNELIGDVMFDVKPLAKALEDAKVNGFSLDLEIVPDAGFALNSHVKRNLNNLAEILEGVVKDGENYNPVIVAEWNQICKNCGDIDELPDLEVIRHLQLQSFYKKYQTAFDNPQAFEKWAKDRIELTADIVQYERWLSIPKDIAQQCDILLIRKGLGGGKTQGLIEFLLTQQIITLLIGYRNTLLNNTIKRSNEKGLSAAHIKAAKEFEQVIKGFSSKIRINLAGEDSITKLWAGCADSFHKFNALIGHVGEYFTALDEIVSVLGHLKSGGTLKKRQQDAISWVTETIENSAFSIMMDANLSDKEVEFIRKLFPQKRILVLDSIHEVSPRTFHFVETKTKKDYSRGSNHLPEHLLQIAKQHKRVLWLSDSQRSCEAANELFVKEGHKHFRLDRKTSSDELAKLFQEDPANFIVTEQLDSASLSPSGESGLSIALFGYFDAVLFDIRGTVGVNTLTQMSARLRDTKVPIFVACPEFVNFTENICPHATHKLEKVMQDKIEWAICLQQRYAIAVASKAEIELIDTDFAKLVLDSFREDALQDLWFTQSLQDAKQLVYEHQNLKLTLKTALLQQGNIINDLLVKINAQTEEEFKETKKAILMRQAIKIFESIDIDFETAQILNQSDQDYDVQCQVQKAFLKHRLPGIEHTTSWSPEFIYQVLLKNPHFLEGRWRLHQLQDEELAKAEFINNNKHSLERRAASATNEEGFNPMEVWSNKSTKLEALREFGVKQLIDGQTFTASGAQAFVDRYYSEESWFNLIEISKAKKTYKVDGNLANTKYVKVMADRLLDFFGLEAKSPVSKARSEKTYHIDIPDQFKNFITDIDNCYSVRAENAKAKAEKISLTELAQTEEEHRKLDSQGNTENLQEVNQPITEMSEAINNTNNVSGGDLPDIYIKEESQLTSLEVVSNNSDNQSTDTWFTPENQNWLADGLSGCETPEDVNDIRCFAPVAALKAAARLLDENVRARIKELTEIANKNRNFGFGMS